MGQILNMYIRAIRLFMKKIIGVGETSYEMKMVSPNKFIGSPSGDILRTMLSLSDMNLNPIFISEIGQDQLGQTIVDKIKATGIQTDYIYRYYDGNTILDIDYQGGDKSRYSIIPAERAEFIWPRIDNGDIVVLSARYSLDYAIRKDLEEFVSYCKIRNAFIIYDESEYDKDLNIVQSMPTIMDNYEMSDIVISTTESLKLLYKADSVESAYKNHIKFYCPILIVLDDKSRLHIQTRDFSCAIECLENKKIEDIKASIISNLYKSDIEIDKLKDISEGDILQLLKI